jgi:hypothetical protein
MNKPLHILFLGAAGGNSIKRAHALKRLGHQVTVIDPYRLFPWRRLVGKLMYYAGAGLLERYLCLKLAGRLQSQRFDLTFVDNVELAGPRVLTALRAVSPLVVNYTNDDPFGARDKNKWRLYLAAIPHYDVLAVVRPVNVDEAYTRGARKVIQVFMAVDELDGPRALTDADRIRWPHAVLFIGTWMPERGPFLQALIQAGLPLAIYGNSWQKAPEWPVLKAVWQGPAIYGDDYIKALQLAKVNLGLLSKGNRDLHTTRTFEIPYAGGLLCAERTAEHLQLYQEDVEAVFWGGVDECIAKCGQLLQDDGRRAEIARRGRQRCLQNGIFNENLLNRILTTALAEPRRD